MLALPAALLLSRADGPAPLPPADAPLLGVVANTRGYGEDAAQEQAEVRRLGVRWLREDFEWRVASPVPGPFRWQEHDRFMEVVVAGGMRVLPLLLGSPDWAAEEELALPGWPGAYAAYVAAFADRYGPGGAFWRGRPARQQALAPRWVELWNEPYLEFFSRGGVDAGRYGRMVTAAVRAGRRANPEVRYLVAGELEYDADGVRRRWVDDMFAGAPGLADAVDGIAVHPYSTGSPRRRSRDRSLDVRRMDDVRAAFARNGAPGRPMWITEIGWSTCEDPEVCTTPERQAAYVRELLAGLAAREPADRVSAVFLYHLRDFRDRPADDQQGGFGLLDRTGRPKPAYDVVARAARSG